MILIDSMLTSINYIVMSGADILFAFFAWNWS